MHAPKHKALSFKVKTRGHDVAGRFLVRAMGLSPGFRGTAGLASHLQMRRLTAHSGVEDEGKSLVQTPGRTRSHTPPTAGKSGPEAWGSEAS